jgi:hypothetical protein
MATTLIASWYRCSTLLRNPMLSSMATSPARSTTTCHARPPPRCRYQPLPQRFDKHRSIERSQQTLKKWLRAQPQQPQTVAELQASATPSSPTTTAAGRTVLWAAAPRPLLTRPGLKPARQPQHQPSRRPGSGATSPTTTANSASATTARLHHIGIGRTHDRSPVLMLINGLDIRIIQATTGEMLRELHLNPSVNYQALGVRKPRPKPN